MIDPSAISCTVSGLGTQEDIVERMANFSVEPFQVCRTISYHPPQVYVGNLAHTVTDERLKAFFSPMQSDVLYARIIMQRTSSAGYGFVWMTTAEAVEKAALLFNGKELDGRQIIIEASKSRKHKGSIHVEDTANVKQRKYDHRKSNACKYSSSKDGEHPAEGTVYEPVAKKPRPGPPPFIGRGENITKRPSKTTLFVKNLCFSIDDEGLGRIFTRTGILVNYARIMRKGWGKPRKSKGCGFVDVGNEENQQKAIELLQNKMVQGRTITVEIAFQSQFKKSHEFFSHVPDAEETTYKDAVVDMTPGATAHENAVVDAIENAKEITHENAVVDVTENAKETTHKDAVIDMTPGATAHENAIVDAIEKAKEITDENAVVDITENVKETTHKDAVIDTTSGATAHENAIVDVIENTKETMHKDAVVDTTPGATAHENAVVDVTENAKETTHKDAVIDMTPGDTMHENAIVDAIEKAKKITDENAVVDITENVKETTHKDAVVDITENVKETTHKNAVIDTTPGATAHENAIVDVTENAKETTHKDAIVDMTPVDTVHENAIIDAIEKAEEITDENAVVDIIENVKETTHKDA
ncbi:uncharacterized protein LAESUDRAFT_763087, partial [Laetiporus sulphureus 93-53]